MKSSATPSLAVDTAVAVESLPPLMQRFYQFLAKKPRLSHWQRRLLAWDTRVCLAANRLSRQPITAGLFKTVSRLGDGWAWAAAVLTSMGLAYRQGQPLGLIAGKTASILLSSYAGYRLYKWLKCHTVRPRPYQAHQVIRLGERPLDVFSFPSGHTLQAVLFTTSLASWQPVMAVVLLPFTLLIGLSRLVLGLHYPTDVLMGAVIGLMFAAMGSGLFNLLAS